VEQLDDVLMRALRQRLGDVEAARRPQHPARLGERAFKLGAGHMMQREHEQHEIGFVVRFGKASAVALARRKLPAPCPVSGVSAMNGS
jgi:hypothetical protein